MCIEKSDFLSLLAIEANRSSIKGISFSSVNFNLPSSPDPGWHYVMFSAEPDVIGRKEESIIIKALSSYEKQLSFITANHRLDGISPSISPLTFNEVDKLRTPASNMNWDFSEEHKRYDISIAYSGKSWTTGHMIREYIFKKYLNDDRLVIFLGKKGDWKHNRQNRKLSLQEFRFNLIIDNTFDSFHVSDQLKDAFLAGCVPIYLGNGIPWDNKYISEWGIDWSGVIDIGTLGLENAINFANKSFYTTNIDAVRHNALCMRNRLISLGWDGLELRKTDRSWLGNLLVKNFGSS